MQKHLDGLKNSPAVNSIFLLAHAIPPELIDPKKLPCWRNQDGIYSDGEIVTPPTPSHGVGILARIAKDGHRVILVDGKTQAGTWVSSSFLELLVRKQLHDIVQKRVLDVLYQSSDFIMVMQSQFDMASYAVEGFPTVQFLWTRPENSDDWHEVITDHKWRPKTPNGGAPQ